MTSEVMASIPVTPDVARIRPASPDTDPLAVLIAEVKADARANGLTDAGGG